MPIQKKPTKNVQKFRTVDDMRDFYAALNGMQGNGEEIALSFNIGHYSQDVCERIVDVAEKTSRMGFKPHVQVYNNNLEFTRDEMQEFASCEDGLQEKGVDFFVSDGENLYSLDETLTAYARVRAVADEIISKGGSPFEKFIQIYQYVTSFIYKENNDNKSSAREIISILNGDDIVCVGYARIMQYLCTAVGIDCKILSSDIFDAESNYTSSHQCNLVYMKDEKYGIDGYYHVDACWDSVRNPQETNKNYNYCLLPLDDVMKHKKKKFNFYGYGEIIHQDSKELFIDYYKSPAKIKKIMNYYGLEFDGKMKSAEFDRYLKGRDAALKKLTVVFKENKVPKDIYKVANGVNGVFEIEPLVVLCLDYEKNKDLIQFMIDQMKSHYEVAKSSKSRKVETDYSSIYDIYDYFVDMRTSDCSEIEKKKIQYAMTVIKNETELFDYISQMKKNSKPISMKRYAHAIKAVGILNGESEEQAEAFAKKAMMNTTKRAKDRFEVGAINVFDRKVRTILSQKGS